jgi:metal-responsive CopG/Arc/MetJ family transcriptional regulator
MALDEGLLADVDEAVARLGTSRSAFVRRALQAQLETLRERDLESRHREGYQRRPVKRGEFGGSP